MHGEGLLFATSLSSSFQPRDFQAVLPSTSSTGCCRVSPSTRSSMHGTGHQVTRGRAAFGVRQRFVAAAEARRAFRAGRSAVVARNGWLSAQCPIREGLQPSPQAALCRVGYVAV